MPEIIMIIERKKDEILSQIKENAYQVGLVSDDLAKLSYRLDNIADDEKRCRDAVQQTIV